MTRPKTRIVSVWLPAWPIERLRRYRELEEVPADRPLALVAHGAEIQLLGEAGGENLCLCDGLAFLLRKLVPAPEGFVEGFVFGQCSPQSEPRPVTQPPNLGCMG